MNKYEKGKIYKIVNDNMPDKVYYGSTIQKLNDRFNNHRCINNNNTRTKELFEKGEPRIELVEDYPCSSKIELEKRERFYIENNKCVNKTIPTRSRKEYREKPENKKRQKEYWAAPENKNRQKEYERKRLSFKITCECGSIISKKHIARHKKTKKHLNLISSSLGH